MVTPTVRLWCVNGQHHWDRPRARARRPRHCPEHGGPAMPLDGIALHPSAPSPAGDDINLARQRDRDRNQPTVALLRRRVEAVAQAEQHAHDMGPWELRQTLVELAAACEEWAGQLPAPDMALRRAKAAA